MTTSGEPGLCGGLPTRFPIFPLPGAILLPNGNLPLNIFEPRYLQMTRDAMRTDRVIGMVQPTGGGTRPSASCSRSAAPAGSPASPRPRMAAI